MWYAQQYVPYFRFSIPAQFDCYNPNSASGIFKEIAETFAYKILRNFLHFSKKKHNVFCVGRTQFLGSYFRNFAVTLVVFVAFVILRITRLEYANAINCLLGSSTRQCTPMTTQSSYFISRIQKNSLQKNKNRIDQLNVQLVAYIILFHRIHFSFFFIFSSLNEH